MVTENEKKFELKIGKSGLIIVLAGMTALLGAAFLFGIDMGQNIDVYPEKITSLPQRALALVWRPAKIKLAQQSAPNSNKVQNHSPVAQESTAAPEEKSIDLNYYKTLTSKKGLANAESFVENKPVYATPNNEAEVQKGKFHIETKPQTVTEKEPLKEKEIVKENETIKQKEPVKQKVTVKQKETAKQKELVKEKEVPKMETGAQETPAANNKFIIQVASLKDKSKAYEMNKKIASLGFQSKIIKTEIKGKGILYRVVASDLNDKAEAQQAAKKISDKTGINCIVKKIDNKIKEN